jgi:hypothetical protein
LTLHQGTAGDVTDAQSRFKATAFIEPVHLRISSAALKQHMIATRCPGFGKCGLNHGTAVTPSTKFRVCYYVLKERMTTPVP